jgi:hypothetical protein
MCGVNLVLLEERESECVTIRISGGKKIAPEDRQQDKNLVSQEADRKKNERRKDQSDAETTLGACWEREATMRLILVTSVGVNQPS